MFWLKSTGYKAVFSVSILWQIYCLTQRLKFESDFFLLLTEKCI